MDNTIGCNKQRKDLEIRKKTDSLVTGEVSTATVHTLGPLRGNERSKSDGGRDESELE